MSQKPAADFDALARTLGAAAKAASEKRHAAALAFAEAEQAAIKAHKELEDLVGKDRAGFYISR
jgi:hypothetical protein